MVDVERENIETGQEDTDGELNQLKKETIERIVDKIKESKQDDTFLDLGKDLVVDYLLDNGESTDKVNDFFLGIGINLFSTSAEQLKDIREKIRNSSTKEELKNLESSIIGNLDNHVSNGQPSTLDDGQPSTGSSDSGNSNTFSDNYEPNIENSLDSARIGEAKEIPLQQRMKRLFPGGVPTKEKDMEKYITKIKVPIYTPGGKTKNLTLHIHKKLANEYKAIFQEMYDKKIPVNPASTGGYVWRKMRRGNKMSHHSYGSAVDVNWDVNGGVYGATVKNSPYYNDQATVNIRKKHGFYRGGDWSKKSDDPMHFTYMNG